MKFYENPLPLPPTNVATPPLLLGRLATREPLAPSPRHAHRRGHRPLAPSPRLAAVSIAFPTAGRLLPLVSPLLFFLTRSSRWKESPFLQARDLPTPATALPRASSGSGEAPIRRGDGYAALQLGRTLPSTQDFSGIRIQEDGVESHRRVQGFQEHCDKIQINTNARSNKVGEIKEWPLGEICCSRNPGLVCVPSQEAAVDADRVYLAAIDRFDAMLSKSNTYALEVSKV
ncbi:hypothetical protein ZWY2020_043618 [Hordeum vulgare]|nr:hypothetical protein ZWY2020_043618 [Hordeum vulgare]